MLLRLTQTQETVEIPKKIFLSRRQGMKQTTFWGWPNDNFFYLKNNNMIEDRTYTEGT